MEEEKGGTAERRSLGGRIPDDVQQQARQKESPVVSELLVAARKGLTERVVQLLQEDPGNAAVTDKHGRNCLHLACIAGHLHTALSILQSGSIQIDSFTKRGHTALHETCQEGHTHLSLLLISLGANLHARSKEGWTPLMCACSRGHTQLVNIVAAVGGNVNDLTRMGLTPLHIAAWKGHTEVVQKLLRLGCNPAAVAHSGKTAQQLATEEEHSETVTVLQAATAKVSREPTYRISSLEGQLRLCQERLAQAVSHHEQVLAAERHLRDEREIKLRTELEQERARVATLEARVGQPDTASDESTTETANFNGRESNEDNRKSNQEHIKLGGPIVKSASSSDLLATGSPSPPSTKLPISTHSTSSSSSSSQHSGERLSITDMVSECLRNPSSMASIRSNLKADNLTPRIQRKFRYKTTSATLPAMGSVPSPLTQDGARAPTETGSLGAAPASFRAPPKDK